MSYCSTHVNEKGEVMCISCRRKFNLSRVVTCAYCVEHVLVKRTALMFVNHVNKLEEK